MVEAEGFELGGGFVVTEGQGLGLVRVGRDDDLAVHRAPLGQQRVAGEEILPVAAVDAGGVDLQHAAVFGGCLKRAGRRGRIPRARFVKELVAGVDLFNQVKMAKDGRLFRGHLRDVCKVRFDHGQAVAVKVVPDAVGQVALAEIDLIVGAGFRADDIVHAADAIIIGGGVVVREKIPFEPAEDIELAGIPLLELRDLRFIKRGAALGHAVFNITGGVAVAGKAQRAQTGAPGRHRQFVQGVFAVTEFRVYMHRTQLVFARHFTASSPVLLCGPPHGAFPAPS